MNCTNMDIKIAADAEALYEQTASEEEIYLEEVEEEVRATLTSDSPSQTAECWRKKREELELGWSDQ